MSAQPISKADRIEALDVMRGIALLGIFIMNMPGFSSSFFGTEDSIRIKAEDYSFLDSAIFMMNAALLEGKFNGLFTLLFGMGIALQLERLSAAGQPAVVLRRLAVLLAFGLLHTCLLWGGDVLHIYAVLGLVLWAVRDWSPGRLLVLGLALLLSQFAHGVVMAQFWTLEGHQAEQRFLAHQMALDNLVYGSGPWWQGVALRAQETWWFYTHEFLWPASSWFWLALLTTAILGLWVQRSGWLRPGAQVAAWIASAAGLRGLAAIFGVALALWWGSSHLGAGHDTSQPPTPEVMLGWMLGDTHRVLMVLCYAGLILRWCQRSAGQAFRLHLSRVGRMPLTMYLMQSLMGTFIFHGWGLGQWDQWGPAALTGLAVLLYAGVQVPLAGWWLSRFEMGPAEAIWRRLSYGAPLRKP
jgi:uncharacterized protein